MNIPFEKEAGNQSLTGLVVANLTSPATSIKVNLTAGTNPSANNDSTQGYVKGSIWVNGVSPGNVWICSENTPAGAVWIPLRERYYNDTGAVNAYVANNSPEIAGAYNTGLIIRMLVANSNTGPSTLNINGLGVQNIKKNGATDLASGDMISGSTALLIYDGAVFQLINPVQSSASSLKVNNFRPTLSSGNPVTTGDVLAAVTIFVTPYGGTEISLYDGVSVWKTVTSAQMSIAVPNVASTMHDIFCFNNAGVATLEVLAWTNATTRATALVFQDGIYVKSGATTRRYIGSFATTAVAGQTEDSYTSRLLYSADNRVIRPMRKFPTGNWAYNSTTPRYWNADATNRLNFVVGLSQDQIEAQALIFEISAGGTAFGGWGLDSNNATTVGSVTSIQGSSASGQTLVYFYRGFVAVGLHYLAPLEFSGANATFFGDNGANENSGFFGWTRM